MSTIKAICCQVDAIASAVKVLEAATADDLSLLVDRLEAASLSVAVLERRRRMVEGRNSARRPARPGRRRAGLGPVDTSDDGGAA